MKLDQETQDEWRVTCENHPNRRSRQSPVPAEWNPRNQPQNSNQHPNVAVEFISNNLSNFYSRDPVILQDLAQNATARAEAATERFGLGPEYTPGLVKLSLYDFVIFCGKGPTDHSPIAQ
jgi:hypothetical protein